MCAAHAPLPHLSSCKTAGPGRIVQAAIRVVGDRGCAGTVEVGERSAPWVKHRISSGSAELSMTAQTGIMWAHHFREVSALSVHEAPLAPPSPTARCLSGVVLVPLGTPQSRFDPESGDDSDKAMAEGELGRRKSDFGAVASTGRPLKRRAV